MNTNSKQLGFLLPILLIAIFVAWMTFWPAKNTEPVDLVSQSNAEQIRGVRINDGTNVPVVVAATHAARQQGLSGKSSLEQGTGMLFVFDTPGKHSFWMKDMHFSIDIIWISENKTVVHVEKDVSPDTFPQLFAPSKNALYVLEVPAGFSDIHHIEIADEVEFF